MKRLSAVLPLLLTMCAPVPAIERDGALSDDDKATLTTCTQANPCAVWSQNEVKALLAIYRQKLIDSGTTCRRDSI